VIVAFCVEDESDRYVFARLVDKVIGRRIDILETPFAVRGFADAIKLAPKILRNAFAKGADTVLFAIDNDDSEPLHSRSHETSRDSECRWCRLVFAANIRDVREQAATVRRSLGCIFAVPVRTIETWLLLIAGYPFSGAPESFGVGPVGRRRLKELVYGTERPDRQTMRSRVDALVPRLDVSHLSARSESFRAFHEQLIVHAIMEGP